MYNDLYLKFTNQEEADAVLFHIEGTIEANPEQNIEAQEGYKVPNFRNIDTIGLIYDQNDPENPIPFEGWHVNVRVMPDEDVTSLLDFKVEPTTPIRVWG